MTRNPTLEAAEAMCELWGHPQGYEDGGCACGARAGRDESTDGGAA